MTYKNIDIFVQDKFSITISVKDKFIFTYDEVIVKGNNDYLAVLSCNFSDESKEYKDLYDWCLKVAKNVLNEVYGTF